MSQSKETLIKRYESTADTYQEKGNREWAYAKNDLGDEHYGKAKKAYEKAKINREKAEKLRNEDWIHTKDSTNSQWKFLLQSDQEKPLIAFVW